MAAMEAVMEAMVAVMEAMVAVVARVALVVVWAGWRRSKAASTPAMGCHDKRRHNCYHRRTRPGRGERF